MTLPSSGAISFNNVNVELSASGTTTRSLNDAAVRSLAEVPSGAISMSNLHGKSSATGTFTPNANGNYANSQYDSAASYTFRCTANATWTYTLLGGGSVGGSVSIANNAVANAITFAQSVGGTSGVYRQNAWNVTGVSGTATRTYHIQLETERT